MYEKILVLMALLFEQWKVHFLANKLKYIHYLKGNQDMLVKMTWYFSYHTTNIHV